MKPPFNAEYQYRCAIDAALDEYNSGTGWPEIACKNLKKAIDAIDKRRAEYDALTDKQYDTFIRLRDYYNEHHAD